MEPDTPVRRAFEAIARSLRESDNPYVGFQGLEQAKARAADSTLSTPEKIEAGMALAGELIKHGDAAAGRREAESALELASKLGSDKETELRLLELCGLACLRQAEIENCVNRHDRECCIVPLTGGGLHEVREPATSARDYYLRALAIERKPYLVWLVNIAAMALGEYPAGVPEPYRIPSSVFDSAEDVGVFEDVAAAGGVDAFNLCGGCIADDFDGDGHLDIVTSTFDLEGPLRFYRGRGDLTFEDRSDASGLSQFLGGLQCLAGDYDNDGDLDIVVLRGAWLFDAGCIPNSLIRNNGDGTFTDVTEVSGFGGARPTQAACFADFDNDGDLDIFVGNESRLAFQPPGGDYPSQLFRNNGDGTFTDIAAEAGVENDRYCKAVTVGDYDNDGDLDLYVSNIGPNRLYRNDGNMRFEDVAVRLGVTRPSTRSFAAWFFDYDNDGWLDLFVTAYQASTSDVALDFQGLANDGVEPCLYRNEGGTFKNVAREVGLDRTWLPMGANFGDLDNDGWLDMYLGTGEPAYEALMPNVFLRNDGGSQFRDVTASARLGHLQKGHGVAFADFDRDGDQDIYHQLGGFYPGDGFRNALFRNPGHGNHWIRVRLEGTRSNRFGLGARIRVRVEQDGAVRDIHRSVGSVSSFGGSPFTQEIGLGNCEHIRSIDVTWPASGITRTVKNVPFDTGITIREVEGRTAVKPDPPSDDAPDYGTGQ